MTIFEQRSNDHPHFAWRCIAEKCTHWTPGGAKSMLHFWSQNVQVNPPEMQHLRFFFPPEIYWGIYWEIFDAIFAFDSKDIFSGFTHSLQAEKAWYTQVPKTFRQRAVIFNGRLKMMSNGSKDPRVSWIFLDVCSTFV